MPATISATSARLSFEAGNESSVGLHDPRSQPTTPGVRGESGEEGGDVEPVGVDRFAILGVSVFSERDEVEADAWGHLHGIGVSVE